MCSASSVHGSGVAAVVELGDVSGDQRLRVQCSAVDEARDNASDQRLGHRHEQVRRVRSRLSEVLLECDRPPVHDHDGIGEGVGYDRAHGARAAVGSDELIVVQALRFRREGSDRTGTPRDALGRHELAQMRERPPVEGRVLPVGQCD